MSVSKDLEWLSRRTAEYHSYTDDAMGMVEDIDELGELGRGFSSMDDLEKVDISDGVIPRPTYVSARLSRELIEHRLPIKVGFRPYKQGARNFKPGIVTRVKEEVDRLLQAGFIQPSCYADWISNNVPVEKNNTGKKQIFVDF
jgi:hypothetical protein